MGAAIDPCAHTGNKVLAGTFIEILDYGPCLVGLSLLLDIYSNIQIDPCMWQWHHRPTLLLSIDSPAKFSSNSNQTHLKQLIQVFRIA